MKVIIIILSVLVLLRLALPWLVHFVVNRQLAGINGYGGGIKKVKISLLPFKVTCKSIHLNKMDVNTGIGRPFFEAVQLDLSIQWRALFHGSVWADILIDQPRIIVIAEQKEKSESKSDREKPSSLKTIGEGVMPFNINLEIRNGNVTYNDTASKSSMEIQLTNLDGKISNFSNIKDQIRQLPATIHATADVYGGTLTFMMSLDPLQQNVAFDMNTEIKNVNLVLLNKFLKAYAGIDVNKGTFGMYVEVAAQDGSFRGYIKPIIRDLDLVGIQDRGDNFFSKLWEGFVAVVYQALKNKSEDQVATKITLEGKLDNPHINVLSAAVLILRNAFVHAIKPSIDDVIDINSVRESVSQSGQFIKNVFKKEQD